MLILHGNVHEGVRKRTSIMEEVGMFERGGVGLLRRIGGRFLRLKHAKYIVVYIYVLLRQLRFLSVLHLMFPPFLIKSLVIDSGVNCIIYTLAYQPQHLQSSEHPFQVPPKMSNLDFSQNLGR
jgi:hypothetical protein